MSIPSSERPPQQPFSLRTWLATSWSPLFLLALFFALLWGLWGSSSYDWQWFRVGRFIGTWEAGSFVPGPLCQGLWMTVELSVAGLLVALPLALLVAGMRLSESPTARLVAQGFLVCTRNTPLLMQLFVVYFVVAPVFGLGPFASAVLALAAFEGSYMAEIFRGGLLGIPKNQWEAAFSLGMSQGQALRIVVLPQAFRNVLPALTGQVISLIKDTSLVSAIAVTDLTMRAQQIITETFLSFEIWLLVAALYLSLTLLISLPARWLEGHFTW